MATSEPFPAGWRARWHMATSEPSCTGRRVCCRGTHGNTRALPYRVTCPVPQGTWQCQSSLTPGAGLESRGQVATPEPFPVRCGVWRCGTRLKSCAWGYSVCRVPTVAVGPTLGEAVNLQVGPIPFPLHNFDDICT
jgi:hypothetical protein